ncbi:MAG: hypothetical protein V1734_04890 [Nanoarchaeota archaeon]
MTQTTDIISGTSGFLKDRFGIIPAETTLSLHSFGNWQKFCSERKLDMSAEGVYLIRNYSALINTDSEFLLQNIFHEYFGHGLYTEYSLPGMQVKALEDKLAAEEQDTKSIEELEELRQNSDTYKHLQKLRQDILPEYEGFAMWMECYLSALVGEKQKFTEKVNKLSPVEQSLCRRFVEYSNEFGEHALFFSTGLPKHYNQPIITDILRKVFKDDFNSIKFAMVYGSRKPYSDIDIFIVSDKLPCKHFGWLDIYSVDTSTFEDLTAKFDISITEPLFTGQFVCGDRMLAMQTKNKVMGSPITQQAVEFHRQHAEKAKQLALQYPEASAEYQTAMRYNTSYLANAKEMEQGRKPLTLANLISRYSQDFKRFKKHYDKSLATAIGGN